MSDIYTHPEPVTMVPTSYTLLERCVDVGVTYGIQLAYKYTDNPTQDMIEAAIVKSVMAEIGEWFDINSLPLPSQPS